MLSLICLIIALVLLIIAAFPGVAFARFSPLALGLVFAILGGFILPRFAL